VRLQTHLETARRFIGLRELPGAKHEPFIQWCHSLCTLGTDQPDETPWCSSWMNGIAFIHGLARSKSAAARSWLKVGYEVALENARAGDVVVFKRGNGPQPGPEVLAAPGHVAFFIEWVPGGFVRVLGGNQSDSVSLAVYRVENILGIREIA
jgi:uncharacterized protein (TIGR02594 family)